MYPGAYNQVAAPRSMPLHPDVKLKRLPFYDIHAELMRPATLMPQGGNRIQEASFQFQLSPVQATNIASNRDIQMGSRLDYLYQVTSNLCLISCSKVAYEQEFFLNKMIFFLQIQLRFFPMTQDNANMELTDEFPPSVMVHVNGKTVQLPNPIPTNKPGVEPKRPPKPVNITPLCKLSPILPNTVIVKWATEYTKQ